MHSFISTIGLALAMITSTLLSTALAAPAAQMVGSLSMPLGEGSISTIERRQCLGSGAPAEREGQVEEDGRAPSCLMTMSQPRQMYGASVDKEDIERMQNSNYMNDSELSDA